MLEAFYASAAGKIPFNYLLKIIGNQNNSSGTRNGVLDSFLLSSLKKNGVELPSPAIIAQQGYPYEEHFVTTRDGYVLAVHRISGPRGTKSGNANPRRKSVLLMHGILMSSTMFLALGPEYSLGYILADAGYDVWLGNFRGNTYSRNHTSLNPDSDKNFWHFSRDEMSEYDVPAMVDLIITQTGHKQVIFIGYSQGGTTGLMTATNRTVAEKIELIVSLGSVGFYSLQIKILSQLWRLLEKIGIYEVLPRNLALIYVVSTFCKRGSPGQSICNNILAFATEERIFVGDEETMPVILANFFEGSSARTVSHALQPADIEFRKFDFGEAENRRRYGHVTPPAYNVSRIPCPVALFWAENDPTTKTKDVRRLEETVPNFKRSYRVNSESFDHADFIFSKKAKTLVYQDIVELLKQY
ncbi:lipase 3-like [Hyalella azteca]|uniref:Lipase n=1 Tax=Hyalella azteca TaxID=294128 RepID=A0A8B7P4J7_HYAAZ|nr:lipase 3-like [Hyalella azteca]